MPHDHAAQLVAPLRLFAKTLSQYEIEADRLVKETLEAAIKSPQEVNLKTIQVHLLSIMRKLYFSLRSNERSNLSEREDYLGCCCCDESTASASLGEHKVEAAIRMLPIHLREAIALVMVLDHSVDEAAIVIGCDADTVSKRVVHAKNILQRKLLQS